jgi:hypothetical protein
MADKSNVRERTFLKIALFLVLLALTSGVAVAVNIGISPGIAVFSKMLRGGYASRAVVVSTSIAEPLTVHYEVYGDVKDWIQVDVNGSSFTISGQNPFRLKVMVRPPSDVQNGNYTGYIRIVTDKLGTLKEGTGSVVKAAVNLQLRVEITGEEILACRAGAFSIPSVEVSYPIEVGYSIINDGNVRLRPHITVDIWDQLQENLVGSREFGDDSVLQTEEEKFSKQILVELPVGQYWANINVAECGVSQMLTFSVLEKGAIADSAELTEVKTKAWATVGEIVPITAIFHNTGSRSVFASFKGKISLGDQIVSLIETDEVQVGVNQFVNFSSFYTPKLPGQYVVSGRVQYNKKLTFEKGSVINVRPSAEKPSAIRMPEGVRLIPLIAYVLIIIVILILLSKIRKQRTRRRTRK